MSDVLHDVAVVGAGGAGNMAWLRAVLNFDTAVLFQGDAKTKRRARSTWVADVDNIPGFHGVQRPITQSGKTTWAWVAGQEHLRDKGVLVKGSVDKVTGVEGSFTLHYTEKRAEKTARARYVVLATGIMDVQPMIGGKMDPIFPYANRGDILYCVRCDGHRTVGHELSVIGQTSSAIHIGALMRERYGNPTVHILTNGEAGDFSDTALRIAKEHRFEIHRAPIQAVLGEPKANGLAGFQLEGGAEVACTKAIVSLGVIAYNQLLTDLGGDVNEDGRVPVSAKYESSVAGLFVVGDLVASKKMQIYTAWDEAVDAADEINRRLRRQRRERA